MAALVIAMPIAAADGSDEQQTPDTRMDLLHEDLVALLATTSTDEPLTVLVVHEYGRTHEAVALLDNLGLPHTTLPRVGVSQVLADRDSLLTLAQDPAIRTIRADHPLETFLAESSPMIHAPQVHEELEVTDRHATVLVIDTGVDALHPDLMDRVRAVAQPHDPMETGLIPDGYTEGLLWNDALGHGTHVAGTVAGTGEALGPLDPLHERYVGIAPGADLVSWAIPGLGGADNAVFQAVQGFEYALENQDRYGIRVITNSWGQSGDPLDVDHPISVATLAAYRAGMSVIFAAGNDGERNGEDIATNIFAGLPWTVGVDLHPRGSHGPPGTIFACA